MGKKSISKQRNKKKKQIILDLESLTTILRVGLGLVLFSGGLSKLSQLLNPAAQASMVSTYMGSSGYINQFFIEYLFSNNWITPWFFLTGLSSFEFVSGIAFIVGFAVRPLSFLWGLLFWTFIIALPSVTTPGVETSLKTYLSPPILIMIRDIALSGMMFVLYNLGSGNMSIDYKYLNQQMVRKINWDHLGLLLRLSIGSVFVVGGLFYGMDHIKSFTTPFILIPIGILMISGNFVKQAGYASMLVLVWYMYTKLNIDKSVIGNLNGIKREFALFSGSLVLAYLGGGRLYVISSQLKEFFKIPKKKTNASRVVPNFKVHQS